MSWLYISQRRNNISKHCSGARRSHCFKVLYTLDIFMLASLLIKCFHRQEGIVVKNPGSIYEPGSRSNSWVKVKPDYIDELRDNCDLLIVGR